MILYIGNATQLLDIINNILLDLINKFNKVVRYKVNIQKSVVYLNTCNEQSKHEIQKTIQFTIASKRTKYLGINFTKEAQNIY